MILNDFIVWQRLGSSSLAIPNEVSGRLATDLECGRQETEIFPFFAHSFRLQTCQREVLVFFPSADLSVSHALNLGRDLGFDVFHEQDAYSFLLKLACGLESEMKGETQILGQIKIAFEKYSEASVQAPQVLALKNVFQKVFEDAKLIRSKHLRSLGASSYGSILRRLLRETELPGAKILVVGAGEFAKSLLPWMKDYSVAITNRTLRKAEDLVRNSSGLVKVVDWNSKEDGDFSGFSHLVLAVSPTPEMKAWFEEKSRLFKDCTIFDLCEPSLSLPLEVGKFWTLTDFYELQRKENMRRSSELTAALEACAELAWQRYHLSKVTFAHGWDDLWVPAVG